ncbi:MAG: hypothetical protein LC790_03090 [Actinobacteria bacterium]|nr:hypothetical protein [Actinomycetota bacterium]
MCRVLIDAACAAGGAGAVRPLWHSADSCRRHQQLVREGTGSCSARNWTARASCAVSATASLGVPFVAWAVFDDLIVASTTSSATWMSSARSSCAVASVSVVTACAPADQRPRPGIVRRLEHR